MKAYKEQTPRGDQRPAVALLVETSNQYSRNLLQGVRQYLREHGSWALHLTEHGRGDAVPPWLANWSGDGIIARIENLSIEQAVREAGVPAINVSASGLAPDVPAVISDSEAVSRLAAEHLLERGIRHFGYCGDARFSWSSVHGRNFVSCIRKAGYTCEVFDSLEDDYVHWEREQQKLGQWLASLPKPSGVMACFDIRGQQVLDVCRRLGFRVPEEVAVIGQHNDELLCELCDPPLSSVVPNPRLAGYRAAELLDGMMDGRQVAARVYPIAPIGVEARQSTDVVAIDDADVADAIRFIRHHAAEGIGVEDVLRAVPVSRSLLERKFRSLLGYSPYEAMLEVRLARAKELLATTELPMGKVAAMSGFSSAEYFSASFKTHVGMSPRQFRITSRGTA